MAKEKLNAVMVYMLADNWNGDRVFIKTLVLTGGTDQSSAWDDGSKFATKRGYTVHGCFDDTSLAFAAIDPARCLELVK